MEIIFDDVGYYKGGVIEEVVWLGGGVVFIVFGKLFFCYMCMYLCSCLKKKISFVVKEKR